MSIALMTEAWKSGQPAGRKMVLLALCDNANDQGECFPSVSMLAQKCSMGERTVQQHIADLENLGILTRAMRAGRSTIYRIDPRKFCTPADFAPPQISHPTPAESAPPPPQNLHPTPADFAPITIKEPSKEPSGNHQKGSTAKAAALEPLTARGISPEVAKAWLDHRKAKRASTSSIVLDDRAEQAALAGLSLEDALRIEVSRGWQGFNAEWVQRKGQQGGGATTRGNSQESREERNLRIARESAQEAA